MWEGLLIILIFVTTLMTFRIMPIEPFSTLKLVVVNVGFGVSVHAKVVRGCLSSYIEAKSKEL